MAKYRDTLPQLEDQLILTDGGLETTLVFVNDIELPQFASYPLLENEEGRQVLLDYYASFAEIARRYRAGLILDTATWRASADWGALLGHDAGALAALNRESVLMIQETRDQFETEESPIVISGCLGPRGDGYNPSKLHSAEEAEHYHQPQVDVLADTRSDLISALTMTHVEEAVGIVRASRNAGMPVAISFTVETDGRLPTGQSLGEAVAAVEEATDAYPAYYGINCAHPTHFGDMLLSAKEEGWVERVRMLRANASCKSHEELDEATELDSGNPREFGGQCWSLKQQLPTLNILGGCCGTDTRHAEAIARSGAEWRGGRDSNPQLPA